MTLRAWARDHLWLWCFAFAGVMLFILGFYTCRTTPPCPPCPTPQSAHGAPTVTATPHPWDKPVVVPTGLPIVLPTVPLPTPLGEGSGGVFVAAVAATSPEYAQSPRWFWRDKALGTAQDYDALRRAIYDASMAQPWPAKGLSLASMEKERAWQIGYTHLREWATSTPFEVWTRGYGFRCVRFGIGVVAVCTNSPDGKSTDQVFVIEAAAGVQWPETRPPATPAK
ncbi:MAG: hypothetical protein WC683_08135 [bacterium]